jgi:hypothetical protein
MLLPYSRDSRASYDSLVSAPSLYLSVVGGQTQKAEPKGERGTRVADAKCVWNAFIIRACTRSP